MNTSLNFKKNTITFSAESSRKLLDMDAAREVLWKHCPWLVKSYALTGIAKDGNINYYVDWKSLFSSPTGKLILLQHGKNIS